MKKSDLKSGMVLVTRDGSRGIVLLETSKGNIIGGAGNSDTSIWMPLDSINEDLTHPYYEFRDIVAVYDGDINMNFGSVNINNLKLLWERPAEPIVLTIDEIAEKFGVDSSLIQIKKG